jgi:hypothetical protein
MGETSSRRLTPAARLSHLVIPDGLEPSFPGCRPGVVAAGPRDYLVSERVHELAAPLGRLSLLSWASGSRGTRTHNPRLADTCFRDRPLIRPDDFLFESPNFTFTKLRGLESNQRPPDSESGVTTSSNCPAFQLDYRLRPSSSLIARRPSLLYQQQLPRIATNSFPFGEKDSNLHRLLQRQEAYR